MLLVPFLSLPFFFYLFFFFFTFFYLFLDADYADDSAVLAYVLKDATFLLHSIERTAKEMRLYLDADKTEFLCFNQDASEGMKSLNGEKIKQVEDLNTWEATSPLPNMMLTSD